MFVVAVVCLIGALALALYIFVFKPLPNTSVAVDIPKCVTDENLLELLAAREGRTPLFFGSADSAHQVEGVCTPEKCNWSRFEAKMGIPSSSPGCRRREHWKDDIQLLKELGVQVFRFSVEWSMIQPTQDRYDAASLEFYRSFARGLKDAGIKPFVTLYHHTLPCWFEDLGGFEKQENTRFFRKFCVRMFRELSDSVSYWATFNEPVGVSIRSYAMGEYPPAKRSWKACAQTLTNIFRAHIDIYHRCKAICPSSMIGIVHVQTPLQVYSGAPIEHMLVNTFFPIQNRLLTNFFATGWFDFNLLPFFRVRWHDPRATNSLDFIGLNYYTHHLIRSNFFGWLKGPTPPALVEHAPKNCSAPLPPNQQHSFPQGFYDCLLHLKRLRIPVIVTENGTADHLDSHDQYRIQFMKQHLFALGKAMEAGVDVRGYIYWSFTDNFEWNQSFSIRYGLTAVDRETGRREFKSSAIWYKRFIRALSEHQDRN